MANVATFLFRFKCSVDPAIGVDPKFICTPATEPTLLVLSNDNDVVPARYQYKTPVQLWKRGSKYVASFSAYFTINFDRSSEFTVRELFGGGGVAFAITPSLFAFGTGPESFGLFPIDEATGASKNGADTQTMAVEMDISRIEPNGFDPQIPHIGLDINSVKSVKTKYLGDPAAFIDTKVRTNCSPAEFEQSSHSWASRLDMIVLVFDGFSQKSAKG